MRYITLSLLAVVSLLAGCTPSDETVGGTYPLNVLDTSSVHIQLSRGMCFGSCPAYTVELTGDGRVRFEGRDYVDSLSPAPVTVGRDTVIAVLRAFETLKFSKLRGYGVDDCYEVTDHPSAGLILSYDGKSHEVDHYSGCSRAPRALSDLEDTIDSLLGVKRWIGNGGRKAAAGATE
jgi:hypothetical protein